MARVLKPRLSAAEEKRLKVCELHDQGMKAEDIAKKVEDSETYVHRVISEHDHYKRKLDKWNDGAKNW